MSNSIEPFISSDTDEWATPPDFVRPLADAVNGFTLDPCSGAENSPIAANQYTIQDDGLTQPWYGDVWCNPPYSDMEDWTDKVIEESTRGETDVILYLCKGDSSTDWWHAAVEEATAVAMIDSRLSFGDDEDSAPFCSHVFIFGDPSEDVYNVLDRRGAVFRTQQQETRTEQVTLDTITTQ